MLEDIINERLKKRKKLESAGYDSYPATVKRSAPLSEIGRDFDKLARKKTVVSVVGRVFGMRGQGGVMFLDLKDESGALQIVLRKDNTKDFDLIRDTTDIGDFIEASGQLITTKKGEQSVDAKTIRMVTKSLRPIPSEWYGIEDAELRLRKRYLDLLTHPELRDLFRKKTKFWAAVRNVLVKNGFLEVETPALEQVPGGADARPFITHHNALDIDLYLRISLELYQKRLLVGGFEKVFEIGRVFRNEGIDAEHLQDYTQVEFYWAYADYEMLMSFLEEFHKSVIKETFGTLKITARGHLVDWGKKWERVDYSEAFKKGTGLTIATATLADLQKKAAELYLKPEPNAGIGRLIDLLYKKTVRPHLIQPTFLINHPVVISPLAKRRADDPTTTERVQVLAYGTELGNGWSELNDPADQRARFEEQMKLRKAGDEEAQMMDEDFVEALEYGMPPAAGFGISERLFSVLVDKPARETVFFPTMRPKKM